MSTSADKARAQRLERLKSMVEARLENPQAALEALLTEMRTGEAQPGLWEALHGAALRDAKEADLAAAYQKVAQERRLQQLEPPAQVEILMHAADYFQGVMGDGAAAEGFLERVLAIAPDHAEAFGRLERRVLAANDPRRLIEFYALVASGQPKSGELLTKAINLIVPLPAAIELSELACKRLVKAAGTHPSILEALDVHCRKTKQNDSNDTIARAGAERLLSVREVAPRAAAALQNARRQARSG
jgi:hypothetical protein